MKRPSEVLETPPPGLTATHVLENEAMAEHAHTTPTQPSQSVTPVTPRRTLFGAAALLALATPARAADQSPDAELLARADRIEADHRVIDTIWDRADHLPSGFPAAADMELSDRLVARGHVETATLANIPALTAEGLKAKARVLMRYSGYDEVFLAAGNPWWSNNDELLGWSIARDLLSGSGRT